MIQRPGWSSGALILSWVYTTWIWLPLQAVWGRVSSKFLSYLAMNRHECFF